MDAAKTFFQAGPIETAFELKKDSAKTSFLGWSHETAFELDKD